MRWPTEDETRQAWKTHNPRATREPYDDELERTRYWLALDVHPDTDWPVSVRKLIDEVISLNARAARLDTRVARLEESQRHEA